MKDLNTDFTFPKLILWSLCILKEHVRQTFKKHILSQRILLFQKKPPKQPNKNPKLQEEFWETHLQKLPKNAFKWKK